MTIHVLRTLFVQTAGTRLILEGDAVKALHNELPPRRLPLTAIDSIVVASGVDVSTPLLVRCGSDGRTVAFVSRFGSPKAVVEGPLSGRGALRAKQHERRRETVSRDAMASSIVAGKGLQLAWALRQWARDADPDSARRLRRMADQVTADMAAVADASRQQALGIEGIATKRYFRGMAAALRGQTFSGRTRRPPTDPVNAALSFLYGMARVAAHGAIHAAGLDPYCGFLHGDRDGQPSLVLDLLEEFRPVVDRVVVSMFNRKQLRADHFATEVSGAVHLTDPGRSLVLDEWHLHRVTMVSIPNAVEPVPYAAIPVIQAARLANAIRNESNYEPHRMRVK